MNTNLRRLLPLVILFALVLTGRSTTGIDESLEFVSPPTGNKFIRWHGVPGWTYFVQVSDPADHLKTWTFAPIIEGGNNEPISYEIDEPPDGLPDKGFFRLKYTDQVPGPNETLDTADFDGDGLTNWDEINIHHTDPLNPDTDGDGMPDGWEVSHALNPNNSADAANIFPGSNVSNLQAFNAGVRADPNATPTNKDGDGAEDMVDADPNDKYVDWEPAGEASYAIVELEQESYGVWSPASVETTVTKKASIGKSGLILYDVSVSHKEPEDDHFIMVYSRTARVWKNGSWSTHLSEQITPKYDIWEKLHHFSELQVCGNCVIGNVDYSHDTIVWDPKSGGTRWNMEPANGTTTRLYSPNDIGGSGTSVEGFNENFAVSPGGALAIVSGSKINSEIAKWRGWFPPGGNASPTYVPGIGESSIQYSYGGNVVEAIEDGGCMVVSRSGAAIVSEGASEFALPNTTYATRHYCISRVPKGVAGDSRIVVAATRIIPNGTDYENGNSMLWIKNGAQIHVAEHTPTIGRVKAIAKNGVILGKGAIWRNGQSITLDSLVDYRKGSNLSSTTRFTNLEGLAMNGEGAIVATADDQLNQGEGHKTLLALIPIEISVVFGVGPGGRNQDNVLSTTASRDRLESYLDGIKVQRNENLWIVRGKDKQGADRLYGIGIENGKAALIKGLKSNGCTVVFDGHANFGIGPNFISSTHKTIANFTNFGANYTDIPKSYRGNGSERDILLNPLQPTETPTQEEATAREHLSEEGWAYIVLQSDQIMGNDAKNYVVPFIGGLRFPNQDSVGANQSFTKKGIGFNNEWHFTNDGGSARLMIRAPSDDLPQLNYKTFFYNACDSGRHFLESIEHGDYIYTKTICRVESATKIFVEGTLNGKTNEAIITDLNQEGVGNDEDQSPNIYAIEKF